MNRPAGDLPEVKAREILAERARILARPAAEQARADRLELLVFGLSRESYALETRLLREVGRFTDFTSLPGASPLLFGITNLRGEILPVFDLRRLAGLPPKGLSDLSRLLVLGEEDRAELGLLADEVIEVRSVAPGEIFAPPETLAAAGRNLLRGVTRDAVMVIDGDALLRDPRLFASNNAAAGASAAGAIK